MADSNTILPAELQNLALKQPEAKKASDGLDQDAFLELMLTQIKNQDPLNPMESGDFLSQMAQFGTVNGITELNNSFATLSGSLQSSQALQASTMVGNIVLVPGNKSELVAGGQISGAVDLNSSTSNLVLNISDASGQSVRQVDLGSNTAGITKFIWNGLDDSGDPLPAGTYTIEAAALINSTAVAQSVLVNAKVESVSLNKTGGEPLLNLGGLGTVSISEVREIM
jgi:flagellar basal-body rod modification protein FlgD